MFKALMIFWCRITGNHDKRRSWDDKRGWYLKCPNCPWESPGFFHEYPLVGNK